MLLEDAGFTVNRAVCDLPTALTAEYGSGDLTVGVRAEYDALPRSAMPAGTTSSAPQVRVRR